MQEIDCYTDASYAKDVGGSFIGYKIADEPMIIKFLEDIKNTEAEVIAAETCILIAVLNYPNRIINLYTDCQKVVDTGYHLSNVKIHKMIGHMKGTDDIHQTNFKIVDKATRKALRQRRKDMIIPPI